MAGPSSDFARRKQSVRCKGIGRVSHDNAQPAFAVVTYEPQAVAEAGRNQT
jgi:hypothetical protein